MNASKCGVENRDREVSEESARLCRGRKLATERCGGCQDEVESVTEIC